MNNISIIIFANIARAISATIHSRPCGFELRECIRFQINDKACRFVRISRVHKNKNYKSKKHRKT